MTATATPTRSVLPALAPGLPPAGVAAVRGGVWGNYVDQLHIFLPSLALAPALVTLAGPHAAVTTGSMVVMATLLARPVGAVVFGRLSDAVGRTRVTRVAIAGTAACSLLIAAVPGHAQIGAWAIGIVLLLRFLGGMFLAGEYTSAIPLAMEWSAPSRRGLASGLIMAMAPWAQATIAAVTVALLAVLGPQEYAVWGWRVSFVAGGLASLVMLAYYSRHVRDEQGGAAERMPAQHPPAGRLADLVAGEHARTFWQMFGLMSGLWLMTNMVVLHLAGRLGGPGGFTATQVSLVMCAAAVAQAVGMSMSGHASSLLGRRRFLVLWGLLAAVAGPVLWGRVVDAPGVVSAGLAAPALQVATVCGYGPMGAYLSERLPRHIRATGYGTAYSASIVLPALWPFWLPWLVERLGVASDAVVTGVLVVGGLLVAGCAAMGPRLTPAELEHPVDDVAHRAAAGTPAGSFGAQA